MTNVTQSYAANIWNGSTPTGPPYDLGNTSFILNCMALVFLMSPGVGFLYSGLLRRKNALSALYLSLTTVAVVSLQWFIMGFSLTFSDEGSPFIGNFKHAFLRNIPVDHAEGATIPFSLFYVYEAMFAALSSVIAIGAFAARGRPGPIVIFVFIWTTLVYDPIAHSIWSKVGWANRLGVFDFAGGTPVHISSGSAALAISIYLRRRLRGDTEKDRTYKPGNPTNVILGTVLLTFGWFGLNGGSAMSPNIITIQACINSNLAAAAGALTGVILDYRGRKKWGPVSFCSGAIAGLVTMTPGSGFVAPPAAVLYGVLGATLCSMATKLLVYVGMDDSLDIFATHGVGGLLGSLLTGVFAQGSVHSISYSPSASGGWVNRNWKQVAYQAASAGASGIYSFVVTLLILKLMELCMLDLRTSKEGQTGGIDEAELGEVGMNYDDFPDSQTVARLVGEAIARTTLVLETQRQAHVEELQKLQENLQQLERKYRLQHLLQN